MAFKQLDVTIWGKKKKVIMTEVKWKKKKKAKHERSDLPFLSALLKI